MHTSFEDILERRKNLLRWKKQRQADIQSKEEEVRTLISIPSYRDRKRIHRVRQEATCSAKDIMSDLRNFIYVIWRHLNKTPTPLQYEVADALQKGKGHRMLIGFRGLAKSWIAAAFVLLRLWWNPELKIMVVSGSGQRAADFTQFLLRLIQEIPLLMHLAPQRHQRRSTIKFDVAYTSAAQSASVRSVGIFGQMTGGRADLIIGDDIEIPHNSDTQTKRKHLALAVEEFGSILLPEGEIIILCTPQNEETIYHILIERGYVPTYFPARYPTPALLEEYGIYLADGIRKRLKEDPSLEGKPTDPERFNELDLRGREEIKGKLAFRLQFLLSTRISEDDARPLKLHDLIFMSLNPTQAPYIVMHGNTPQTLMDISHAGRNDDTCHRPLHIDSQWGAYSKIVMAIDPSGRGKNETSYVVLGILNGLVYMLDWYYVRGGYKTEALERLALIAQKFKVHEVTIEDNMGDGMFTALFKPVLNLFHKCTITEVKEHKQKEMRIIDRVEPITSQHRLIVEESLIARHNARPQELNYFYQYTHLTKEKGCLASDDGIDVLSLGVSVLVSDVDVNVEDMKKRHKVAELRRIQQAMLHGLINMNVNRVIAGAIRPTGRNFSQRIRGKRRQVA